MNEHINNANHQYYDLKVQPYWKQFPGYADNKISFRSSKVLLKVGKKALKLLNIITM